MDDFWVNARRHCGAEASSGLLIDFKTHYLGATFRNLF